MGERETGREVKEMGTQEAGWQEEAKGRSEEPETIKDKEKTAAYSHQPEDRSHGQGRGRGACPQGAKKLGRDGCNITINYTDTGHADDTKETRGGERGERRVSRVRGRSREG